MQPDPLQDPYAPATRPVSQWERALLAQCFAGTARSRRRCLGGTLWEALGMIRCHRPAFQPSSIIS